MTWLQLAAHCAHAWICCAELWLDWGRKIVQLLVVGHDLLVRNVGKMQKKVTVTNGAWKGNGSESDVLGSTPAGPHCVMLTICTSHCR
jgi:hypothetical protein